MMIDERSLAGQGRSGGQNPTLVHPSVAFHRNNEIHNHYRSHLYSLTSSSQAGRLKIKFKGIFIGRQSWWITKNEEEEKEGEEDDDEIVVVVVVAFKLRAVAFNNSAKASP